MLYNTYVFLYFQIAQEKFMLEGIETFSGEITVKIVYFPS